MVEPLSWWLSALIWGAVVLIVAFRAYWLEWFSSLRQRWSRAPDADAGDGMDHGLPRKLGVVLTAQLQLAALQRLSTLVHWAECKGVQQLLLYDAPGWLQEHRVELEKLLSGNASRPVSISLGWPAPVDLLAEQPAATGGGMCSRKRGNAQQQQQAKSRQLEVVLLTAADAPSASATQQGPRASLEASWTTAGLASAGAATATAAAAAVPAAEADVAAHAFGLRRPSMDPHSTAARLGGGAGKDSSGYNSCRRSVELTAFAASSRSSAEWASMVAGSCGSRRGSLSMDPAAVFAQQRQSLEMGARRKPPRHSAELSALPSALAREAQGSGGSHSGRPSFEREPPPHQWPLQSSFRSRSSFSAVAYAYAPSDASEEMLSATSSMGAMSGPLAAAAPGDAAVPGWLVPELVMVVGDAKSLAEYPPWAARCGKLVHAGPLDRLHAASLDFALERYLGTEQCCGA
ncbi:hypothetical protein N2152v2_008185 [Parachlorella kessleri]